MKYLVFVLLIGVELALRVNAQTTTLSGSGNINVNYSSPAVLSATGTANLSGYGSASLTISGTIDFNSGAQSTNFALDFGGGNVLRGPAVIGFQLLSTGYPNTTAGMGFTIGSGSGRFANEIGSFALNAQGTITCLTPPGPGQSCMTGVSGPFSFSGSGMMSVKGGTQALAFTRSDLPFGAGTNQVLSGDFNGDHKPDLAVFSKATATLSILLGNGDGTFQSHAYTGLSVNPNYIGIADFNGDGKLDVLIADGNAILFTLLGNGDGTFQQPKVALQQGFCCDLVIGDWKGDHIPDVAEGGHDIYSSTGKGDGTFSPFTRMQSPGIYGGASQIATADVNGDGKPDSILSNYMSSYISVFLGNGDGTFKPPVNVQATDNLPLGPIAVADLNGDGKPDLVFAQDSGPQVDTNGIAVMLGNGDGTFQPSVSLIIPTMVTALAIADVNRMASRI